MRSLEWTLILYDWCPYKKKDTETDKKQEECPIMTEAGIGMMQWQAKELQRLQPRPERGSKEMNGKEGVRFYPEFRKEYGPTDPLV